MEVRNCLRSDFRKGATLRKGEKMIDYLVIIFQGMVKIISKPFFWEAFCVTYFYVDVNITLIKYLVKLIKEIKEDFKKNNKKKE